MDLHASPSTSYFDNDYEPKSCYLTPAFSTVTQQKRTERRVSFTDDTLAKDCSAATHSESTLKKLCKVGRQKIVSQNHIFRNDKENTTPNTASFNENIESIESVQKALDVEKERVNYLYFVIDELHKRLDLKDRSLSNAREEQGHLHNRIGRLEDFASSLQGELFASKESIQQFDKKESEWKKRISDLEQELLEERARDKKVQAYLKQLRKVQSELGKAVQSTFTDLNDAKIKFQAVPAATEEKIKTRVSCILSRNSYDGKQTTDIASGFKNATDEQTLDDDIVFGGLGCINASVIPKRIKTSVQTHVQKFKTRSSLRDRLLQEFTEKSKDVYLSVTEDMSTLSEIIQSLEEVLMKTQEESAQLQMLLDRNTKERKKERFGLGYLERLAAEVSDFLGKKDLDCDDDKKPDNSFHLAFETDEKVDEILGSN